MLVVLNASLIILGLVLLLFPIETLPFLQDPAAAADMTDGTSQMGLAHAGFATHDRVPRPALGSRREGSVQRLHRLGPTDQHRTGHPARHAVDHTGGPGVIVGDGPMAAALLGGAAEHVVQRQPKGAAGSGCAAVRLTAVVGLVKPSSEMPLQSSSA